MNTISTLFSALFDPIIFIPIIMAAILSANVSIPIFVGFISAYVSVSLSKTTGSQPTLNTYVLYLVTGAAVGILFTLIAKKIRETLRRNRMRIKIMRWHVLIDGKSWIVVLTLLFAYLVTAVAAHLLSSTLANESTNMWVSIYSSWAVNVVFFTVVGLVVTLMGFRSPAEEHFENRVSILYSGKREPRSVMQYNSDQIRRLAAYATCANRKLVVHEYSPTYKAYRVNITTTYTFASLLDDVLYEDEAGLGLTPDQFQSTPPPQIGKVLSIWFKDEKLKRTSEITEQGFSTNIPLALEPGETEDLRFEYEKWIPIEDENYLTPQRVVELFEMSLVNRCNTTPLIGLLQTPVEPISLLFNQTVKLPAVRGVVPGEKIFRFEFREPT